MVRGVWSLSSGPVLTVFCRKKWKNQKVSWSCSTINWKSITIWWKPRWYSMVEGASEEGLGGRSRAWAWAEKEFQEGIEEKGLRGSSAP